MHFSRTLLKIALAISENLTRNYQAENEILLSFSNMLNLQSTAEISSFKDFKAFKEHLCTTAYFLS